MWEYEKKVAHTANNTEIMIKKMATKFALFFPFCVSLVFEVWMNEKIRFVCAVHKRTALKNHVINTACIESEKTRRIVYLFSLFSLAFSLSKQRQNRECCQHKFKRRNEIVMKRAMKICWQFPSSLQTVDDAFQRCSLPLFCRSVSFVFFFGWMPEKKEEMNERQENR